MQSAGMVLEERMQQLGYFSLFISRELRIEDVNAFQASKALRNCSTITPAIGISINPLYSRLAQVSNVNFVSKTDNLSKIAIYKLYLEVEILGSDIRDW